MKRPGTWLLCVIALLLMLYLLGCALRTAQSLEIFSRDHSRHETNAVPNKP